MRNLSFLPGRMSWLGFLTLVAISSVQVGGLHANTFENSNIHDLLTCDNVTDGGSIEGDEIGCPDPIFDPSEIINVVLPSGGSGDLEYVWMYTTVDPALPITLWQALPNSNSPSYDPGPITTTTWYRRCSRRSGCTEYTGETGYVTKEVKCCENVDNPGIIGSDQESCNTPFDPDVIVNISLPSGGSGNLVYAWYTSQTGPPFDPGTWSIIPGANQPTFDPGAVSTTTWYIRAARREDCSDFLYSNPVVMQILDGPVVSGVIQHVDCFGQSTGGINLSVTGGAPGYEYDWDNAPDVENPSNLVAGIYSVMVSDQNGCEATASFEVEQPPLLVLSGVVANPVCNGLATGSIDLTVAGGTPGYTYLWSTGATTPDLSGLNAGVYAVTVTDQNGCTQTGSYPINEPSALILSITKMDVSCAGAADGSIQLTVTGGTPGYTYLWSTGATTPDLSGLNAGVYAVTVTDQNGCTKTGSYPINEPSALILNITKTDVSCAGASDGSIQLTVTGGTPGYTYLWSTGATTPDLSGLNAGVYAVTVTDQNGCTKTGSYPINEPSALILSITKTDVSCAGAADGSIQLTVTGGTPGYTYLWSTGATTPDLAGLNAGVYAVTVTDQNGCTQTGSYPINEPSALILNITKTDVSCAGASDGSIQLTVTGGTPGYTYLWSTGATTPDLSGLNAGVYTVTVTDQNGCTQTGSYPINEPSALILNITKTDVSCAGASDGSIQLTVTGGTIPYTYTWSNGASSKDIQNISGGTYAVTVSDGNGCSNSKTVVIDEPTPISLTIVSSDPDCIGGNDGSTEVTATGGSAPYTYLWNDPAQHTTALCSGLGMGVYSVTVTDQHGCTAVEEVTISDGQDDCQIDIGDFVWLDSDRDGIQDSNEYGENGILVKLVQTGPDGDYGTWDDLVIDSVYTSGFGFNTGYYLFTDVQPGTYSICFVIDTSAFQFTLMDEGGDDGKDSDPHPGTGCIEAFTILPDSKDNLTFDAGIHARCVNVTSGGSIGYDEVLCKPGADPENIQNIISPAGGLGQMEYLWLQSDSDPMYYPGNPQWEAIPNSNSPEFDPLTIDVTTYFIRCARREGCLNYPGETNIVTKTIEDPLAEISGPSGPLCVDEGYFFMATSNGPNATYEWDFGPHGHPQTASGLVVNNVSWDISGIQTVTLTVTVSGCEASISTPFEIEACGGKHVIQSFSAYVNINHDVDLKWFSEKYQDEHVFVIERSIDGVDFQYVATVKGEVNQDLWYPYRDENPIWGENYYRLRMVSIQGVMAISEVKRVVVKEVDMFNVSIFPNPASTQFEIRLLETRPQEARVIFYDLLGREIHSTTIEPGQKSVFVNCQDWPDGLVIAWVIQEGKRPFSIPLQKIK